jgi:hypothetical protein
VAYGSQRRSAYIGYRAIEKVQTRLKGLSKYKRKPQRERLLDRLIERQVFVEGQIDELAR